MTGSRIPSFLYGTAWKEETTRNLTTLALSSGFVGIDTANQRKHYFEEAVGLGIEDYLNQSGKNRNDLFLQTKFTYLRGQDDRLPYDPKASLTKQLAQSFESSLGHLKTTYIDSYLLHGPSHPHHLTEDDFEVWAAMESLVKSDTIKYLGVSNVNLTQLKDLWGHSQIKPQFVQNRCYAIRGWDLEVRNFCIENKIIYQGFSLLTANLDFLRTEKVTAIAKAHQATIPQITFAFAIQVGMLPLTGTSNAEHMKQDLLSSSIKLSQNEIQLIQTQSGQSLAGHSQ